MSLIKSYDSYKVLIAGVGVTKILLDHNRSTSLLRKGHRSAVALPRLSVRTGWLQSSEPLGLGRLGGSERLGGFRGLGGIGGLGFGGLSKRLSGNPKPSSSSPQVEPKT